MKGDNYMKKIIMILAALMLLTVIAVPVFAADTQVAITASGDTFYKGDEVTLTVSVSGATPYTLLECTVSYDEQVFEYVRHTLADNTGASTFRFNQSKKNFAIVFDNPTAYAGRLGTVTLKVKNGATIASTSLSISATAKDTVSDPNADINLPVTTKSAQVAIGCNHNYNSWTKKNDSEHTGTCANGCGIPKTESHNWTAGTVTSPASCTEPGVRTRECTVCKATKEEKIDPTGHAWSNDCDTTCNNNCGTTRSVSHKYSTAWSSDGKNHWHACSVCGDKKDTAAHTAGAAATETTPQKCTVCSYVIQPALGHVHEFEPVWQQNSDYHWHVCRKEGCHETQGKNRHDYDDNCDLTCNTCGYIRIAPHEFGTEWRGNEKGHWHVCTLCNESSEIIAHVPGDPATEDTPQLCTECQFWIKFPLSHEHTFGDKWEADDLNHWKVCNECKEAADIQPHTWDDGTVKVQPTQNAEGSMVFVCQECKTERTATLPKLETNPDDPTEPSETQPIITPSEQADEFPWWTLIVVAGVLLVAGIALFVFEFIRSKKHNMHGKFSK